MGPFLAIYLSAAQHWNTQQVGIALSVAGFTGMVAQLPAGALVDWARAKRGLVLAGVFAVVAGAILFAFHPTFVAVIIGQVLLGGFGAIFAPVLNAISLGLVGLKLLDWRVGRNQAFNSAGNFSAAILMGLIGYFLSYQAVFLTVALMAIPTFISLAAIRPREIDYDRARGAKPDGGPAHVSALPALLKDPRLLAFLATVFLFHFANAAMLPQLGEMLAEGRGRQSSLFMGACVLVTQLVISLVAVWVSRQASRGGRKPLLLLGYGVLPVRGVLYTVTAWAPLLIGIQVFDGIANAIYLVVGVLVIADLTRGTGRFNLALGALGAAQGLGASASTTFAGLVTNHYGFKAGFLALAGIALIAWLLLLMAVPETGGAVAKPSLPAWLPSALLAALLRNQLNSL